MQTCPHCGKENAKTDPYCFACGHILPVTLQEMYKTTVQLEEIYKALETKRRWGTAFFGQSNQLQLNVRGSSESLILNLAEESILGRRHDDASLKQPDVDLIPFGALEKGVSRLHALLMRQFDTVTVTDLSSLNGTYLNGQRLLPYEPRIVRDEDELRFGRLVVTVAFLGVPSTAGDI